MSESGPSTPPPRPTKPAPSAYEAFGHRDFRVYLAMRTLFLTGQQMQTVAVGWQLYELTRRPIDLGYAGLALFLPQILLALPAGQAADRFDRRFVVIAASALALVCPAALLWLSETGTASPLWIFALLFVFGIGRTFIGPATQALLPALVPRPVFVNAMSWRSSTGQAAVVGGPALGGFVYALGGSAVYGLVIALTILSIVAGLMLGTRPQPRSDGRSGLRELLAGVRFVRDHPVLLGAISLDLFAVLFGGATALLPIYARDILAVGPGGLGLLRSAPAVGSIASALWLAGHPLRRHSGRSMFLCVAGFGLATIAFGLSRDFYLSLAALVVTGACDMVSVYVRQTLVQLGTPDAMRGRVNAVSLVFVGASNELGEFESGVTAAWFGTVSSVVIGGVGTLAVVGIWAWRFASLRRIDRLDQIFADPRA